MASLFAGVSVSDYSAALPWYERLFGSPPTFVAHETECVWDVTEGGSVYINEDPARAGHSVLSLFVENLDATIGEIRGRGLEPAREETYSNGVRKATFRDADGNEIGFGGAPDGSRSA